MAEDVWLTCDLPTLEAVARLEGGPDPHFGLHNLATETGFDIETVKKSLRRLESEFVTFTANAGDNDPLYSVRGIRLLGAGRRATRQWPSPEDALSVLVDALTTAAEQEQDPEKKSRLEESGNRDRRGHWRPRNQYRGRVPREDRRDRVADGHQD